MNRSLVPPPASAPPLRTPHLCHCCGAAVEPQRVQKLLGSCRVVPHADRAVCTGRDGDVRRAGEVHADDAARVEVEEAGDDCALADRTAFGQYNLVQRPGLVHHDPVPTLPQDAFDART